MSRSLKNTTCFLLSTRYNSGCGPYTKPMFLIEYEWLPTSSWTRPLGMSLAISSRNKFCVGTYEGIWGISVITDLNCCVFKGIRTSAGAPFIGIQ
jgi:hypothetical protein